MRKKSNWRKAPKVSKLAEHEENAELALEDEDLELFEEYGGFSRFLTSMNPEELTRNEVLDGPGAIMRAKGGLKTARANAVDSDDEEGEDEDSEAEASYENRPRSIKAEWKKEEKARLPIRGDDGVLKMQQVVVTQTDGPDSDEDEESEEEEEATQPKSKAARKKLAKAAAALTSDPTPKPAPATPVGPPKSRTEQLLSAQEKLADMASSIIEDPEKNISNLKNIRQIGSDKDLHIRKLALLTQLAVYKDIIPGYRIRQLTEAELAVKVTKEVKKLRQYEEILLSNYQAYLQVLENTVQSTVKSTDPADSSLLVVAIQCMADLLTTVTHFNFRLNLMTAVVARMTLKTPPEVSVICCNAICRIFSEDESGEASLEAVKLIAKAIKAKHYQVHEEVLKTLLNLHLDQAIGSKKDDEPWRKKKERAERDGYTNDRKRKRNEKHVSKKMRKVERRDKEVEKEFKEAEATYDREDVLKRHTEALKFVFLIYFRILKNATNSPLLPAVLEGLARFAHLINIEFFADLLNVLKKISFDQYRQYLDGSTATSTDTRSAFHCVIAAFQLLTGQGEALNLDLKDFYTSMYAQMMRLPMNASAAVAVAGTSKDRQRRLQRVAKGADAAPGAVHLESRSGSEIELALQGFELLFYKKRAVPVERVAAFVKRLATVALHLPPHAVLACLSIIRSLVIRFPRLESLLDAEGRIGTGVYRPLLEDPELSNPFATNMWELSLFLHHYHPTVRTMAKHVASTVSITQKGATQVTNAHKPLPGALAGPPREFLSLYDPNPNAVNNRPESFRLTPAVTIPTAIGTVLKRKQTKGIKYADGPAAMLDSPFMETIRKRVNA